MVFYCIVSASGKQPSNLFPLIAVGWMCCEERGFLVLGPWRAGYEGWELIIPPVWGRFVPFADLFGWASVGEEFAHFLCDCGPLGSSLLFDEGDNDPILLSKNRTTSALHNLLSAINYKMTVKDIHHPKRNHLVLYLYHFFYYPFNIFTPGMYSSRHIT